MPGYPDFRRQQDYDSFPPFIEVINTLHNNALTRGPFYVGLWHAIALDFNVSTNSVLVIIRWWNNVNADHMVGERNFVVDVSVGVPCRSRFINLGPYVSLTIEPVGAVNWTEDCLFWPTNRVHPVEMPAAIGILVNDQPGALGAGLTSTVLFEDYFAGPATWRVAAGAMPGTFQLQSQTLVGTWVTNASRLLVAGVQEDIAVTIPPGACRSQITNTGGGAGSFGSVVTPSITGG